ncbi:MAG: antibiotic biosynthesis monooxygenase [Spirochaetaceae bacterium]|nr:antibiotic biosynthesis monooxygenase [Spirochaetaceae bacterium]
MKLLKNETQLVCIARFSAIPGEEEQLIENLHKLIALTTQEGGCLRYELNQSMDKREEITFIEKWYDKKTFDEHCAKPYIVEFFKGGNPEYVKSFDVSLHKELLPSVN